MITGIARWNIRVKSYEDNNVHLIITDIGNMIDALVTRNAALIDRILSE